MKHGVIILPDAPWATARERWIRAEELGFDHAWLYDHLVWRWFREKPWFATMPTLTAVAAVTTRIAFGTLVASPVTRHPLSLAKDVMTLDDISGGRVVCGIGRGAGGYDESVVGAPARTDRERQERFSEFVELTDRLLRDPVTSHLGKHYAVDEAQVRPGCVQRPRVPLAVAATGPAGIALAARYADIWVTTAWPGHGEPVRYDRVVPVLTDQSAQLDAACAAIGRDPSTVRRLVVTGAMIDGVLESVETYRDACGLLDGIGFTDLVVHWPRAEFPYQASMDVLEDIAATVIRPGARGED